MIAVAVGTYEEAALELLGVGDRRVVAYTGVEPFAKEVDLGGTQSCLQPEDLVALHPRQRPEDEAAAVDIRARGCA